MKDQNPSREPVGDAGRVSELGEDPHRVLMDVAKEMNHASMQTWYRSQIPDLMSLLKGWAGWINDVALGMAPKAESSTPAEASEAEQSPPESTP